MHGGKQPSNRTCCYIEANSYIRLPPCYHVYIPYIDLREYPYTNQLLAIEGCRRPDAEVKLPSEWYQIITPIHLDFWKEELTSHPDTAFSAWICNGFEKGFRVGYSAEAPELRSSRFNMLSATEHPQVVAEYIGKELSSHHLIEVNLREDVLPYTHISPLGVIPKKGRPNCWRMIMDLSSPSGHSVNDGIAKELCSLRYASLDLAAAKVAELGSGALLAKMDICQAYRNIPVAPEDKPLLGLKWNGRTYVDQVLPFGLRSAPMIFSAIADGLLWIMKKKGASWAIHYIDDFLTIGAPFSEECRKNTITMQSVCDEAGLPVEPSKSVGPTTCITFLGIQIDSIRQELSLPKEKLNQLQEMITQWRGRKACKKRELLSLIGSLSHACKVIRAGRAFLRRLIDLSMKATRLDHFIRINAEARADLEWWFYFIGRWNGISLLSAVSIQPPAATIYSDASGNWGCGAICGSQWFQLKWDTRSDRWHISIKELTPIVISTAIWGRHFMGKTLLVRSDNSAAVAAINSQSSAVKEMTHLLRCLAFISARFQVHISALHVPGRLNAVADALSRNNLATFYSLYPQAARTPSPVPATLIDLLIPQSPDWNSQHWTALWNAIFPPEYPRPPLECIQQGSTGTSSCAGD